MSSARADFVAERLPAPAERGSAVLASLASTPFLGLVLALCAWPVRALAPSTGPDPSWVAGLYMAHQQGLQWGTEIVFTYGPLGFLQEPVLYDGELWALALLYRGAVHAALALSLVWAARRALPLPVALLASYAVLAVGGLEGGAVLLALVWALVALRADRPRFAVPAVVFGGAALGAVELLGKANFGIGVLAICAIAVAALPGRRRNLPLFAATAGLSFLFLWLLAGQSIAALDEFVANGLQLLSGYSSGMAADVSSLSWELPLAGVLIGLLLAATALGGAGEEPVLRVAALAVVALFCLLAFKQGFVRQGLGNTPNFFALLLGAGLAVAAPSRRRLGPLPPWLAGCALLVPLLLAALAALPGGAPWRYLDPDPHVASLRQELDALLDGGERGRLVASARRAMRSSYGVDARTLALVGERPVHVEPWEIGVAWAYGLNWHPLPAIQDYAAYTPRLDALNRDALRGGEGPALILRQNTALAPSGEATIDGRLPAWDPPAAKIAMLCRYAPLRTTARWQLLERVPDRCGPPRRLATVAARTGEAIPIPPPPSAGDLVFARVEGLGVDGAERLRSALYRARFRTATLDGRRGWRLAPATLGDGLVLRMAPALDYPAPFALAPGGSSIAFAVEGGGERQLSVGFYARRLEPWQEPAGTQPAPRRLR
jgi:hypothetical protein